MKVREVTLDDQSQSTFPNYLDGVTADFTITIKDNGEVVDHIYCDDPLVAKTITNFLKGQYNDN